MTHHNKFVRWLDKRGLLNADWRDPQLKLTAGMRRTMRYYQALHRATPPWANQDAISYVYKRAKEARRPFRGAIKQNPSHPANVTVDHVVPLCHSLVCGLHCEDNLEIVHHDVNRQKSNYHWPDMWDEQLYLDL